MVQIVAIMLFLSRFFPHLIVFTLCEYEIAWSAIQFNAVLKSASNQLFLSYSFSVTLALCLCPPRGFLSRPLFVNTPLTFKYIRKHKSKALLFTFLAFSLSWTHNNHRNSRFFLRFCCLYWTCLFLYNNNDNEKQKSTKERVATVKLIWRDAYRWL